MFRKKKIFTPLLAVVAMTGLAACQTELEAPNDALLGDGAIEEDVMLDTQPSISIAMNAEGREFSLDGDDEANPTLVVSQGSTVEVTLCSAGGTHNWVVDDLGISTAEVSDDGDCDTIEFTADQVGEFEYYCSVGNHREEGMVGTLVVE
ncbi:blue (type 1) copper domain protein [Cyanobacterium stanieri PCC 7202]|uniref:Blue (Type 1) copper domain protein n=1 Tax=Cyanobacterium stanieri (strain ATCC 29140 / PCC 7202) TaxID=292563 RepID=K9YQB3_CYASC|nr:blue (type 1) copper domain protein [Cyanobacterium stanieri PCC 7202]